MLRKGSTIIAGVATNTKSNSNTLLSFKWSDHIINSMEWLRSDTFSWQSGSVYVAAYNHLTADISTATQSTETIAGTTITVYTATDGHKIVLADQESAVSAIYSATGVAWYYIVDTANTRFKLPRTTSLSDAVKGNGMTLGLTDGTNTAGLSSLTSVGLIPNDNIYGSNKGTAVTGGTNGIQNALSAGITTDSTKSGIVVERSTDSQHKYLYFYVGEYSQSATEQTAGITTEQLNGKVDTDLSNMNASSLAKETIVGWGIPDLTAGVSISSPTTSHQMTYDCVVVFEAKQTGDGGSKGLFFSTDDSNWIGCSDVYGSGLNTLGHSGMAYIPKNIYIKIHGASGSTMTVYPLKGNV